MNGCVLKDQDVFTFIWDTIVRDNAHRSQTESRYFGLMQKVFLEHKSGIAPACPMVCFPLTDALTDNSALLLTKKLMDSANK